jgi:hypothetical protein
MKNRPLTLFFFIIPIFLISCRTPRYVFTPVSANVPVLTQKGQGTASASYGTARVVPGNGDRGPANGGDFMGAYAFHKNLGVQTQYSFRNEREQFFLKDAFILPIPDSGGTSLIRYNRRAWEGGVGGFLPINSRRTIMLNLWVGVGTGTTRMQEDNEVAGINYQRHFDFSTFRTFWQPYISFNPSPYFQISYFFKFSRIKFSNVETNLSEAELLPRRLQTLENTAIPVTEGGYNMAFGFRGMESFRVLHQMSFAASNGHRDIRGLNVSLGLQYNFGNQFLNRR